MSRVHPQRRRQAAVRSNFSAVNWTADDAFSAYPYENRPGRFPYPDGNSASSVRGFQGDHYGDGPCTSNYSLAQFSVEEDSALMSRDELENRSPSRKDGINLLRETHLRYSYCAFLQNLGFQLNLPHTTIGTAMVLCHRFFARRSHASHDRFLIATAALFLAAKSEETPCPLNTVLRASWEICERQNPPGVRYLFPGDWFEQYRESVISSEHMILTTLNFELEVHHPYTPLKSVLYKLGLSQSVLLNLALNLINEGILKRILCSSMSYSLAGG